MCWLYIFYWNSRLSLTEVKFNTKNRQFSTWTLLFAKRRYADFFSEEATFSWRFCYALGNKDFQRSKEIYQFLLKIASLIAIDIRI